MNWKSWPYWVKGGITAIVAGVVSYVLLLIANRMWAVEPNEYILAVLLYFPMEISEYLVPLFCTPPPDPVFACLGTYLSIGIPLVILELVAIGTLLGYLYGKFKTRKQLST